MKISDVYVETFFYPTEDKEKVIKALQLIIPEVKVKEEKIKSYYGSKITKIFYETRKQGEIKKIFEKILKNLSLEDREKIQKEINERLDNQGFFYLRFDKQQACLGKLVLCYNGDVIKTRIKLVSYPFSLTEIRKAVQGLFK